MASLKDLRNRIASVKATQKITKAMQMVAAAKLRRAQEAAEAARPYSERIASVMRNIAGAMEGGDVASPLMAGTGKDDTHLFVVFTSDRGLCGGFNAQKQAFDSIRPGEVVVIEARGESGSGTLGDILALRAKSLGAAGVVTDGGVRDSAEVAEILPVFSTAKHPAVLGRKHVPWE